MKKYKKYIAIFLVIVIALAIIFFTKDWIEKDKEVTIIDENDIKMNELLENKDSIEEERMQNEEMEVETKQNKEKEQNELDNSKQVQRETKESKKETTITQKKEEEKEKLEVSKTKENTVESTRKDETNVKKEEITENTKEEIKKEEESNINEKLANTFVFKYNSEKTQQAVSYIQEKMKKDPEYKELGGEVIAVREKPSKNWVSYTGNSKLNGVTGAGRIVKVYVEDVFMYDNRGMQTHLYDTRVYLLQTH